MAAHQVGPTSAESTPGVGRDGGEAQPFVVVLTGGPCAGKSSAMAILRDRLSVRGFQVLTVPENATHFLANSDGFQAEWAGKDEQVDMQRIFVDYQLAQEDAFKAFGALHPRKQSVLLLDCCTLTSKVYLTDEQWTKVLELPGKPVLTESELLSRYDLVIHMTSCAFSAGYEYGPGSNNPGRYHTPEQAKDCDTRCVEVFVSHPQMRVVPPCPDFDDKINRVLGFVDDALHVEGLAGLRRRKMVSVTSLQQLLGAVSQDGTSSFVITSTFLDEQLRHSVRRRVRVPAASWFDRFQRLRKADRAVDAAFPLEAATPSLPHLEKDVLYERRTFLPSPLNPAQGCLTRRVVHEEEYYGAVGGAGRSSAFASAATKHVLSFKVGTNYFELFFFAPDAELLMLDHAQEAPLPAWLELAPTSDQASLPAAAREGVDAALGAAMTPDKRKRPCRELGRHTTEEAAFHSLKTSSHKRSRHELAGQVPVLVA